MRPPLPFSKEKAESSLSVISVPETSARPSPAASRISTSTLRRRAAPDDRVGDQRHRGDQAGGAQRRQLGGEDACLEGTMSPLEDRAAPALARATPASGKTSVISTSLRRGAASETAPTAVTSAIGVAIATSSHHQRRQASTPSPASAEQHDQDLDDPAGGRAHRLADPAAPHPPDLAGGHRRVADRVFAEVLGEVLLADLAERRVARQVGVAGGDPVEERRRVDPVERLGAGREVAVQVALDEPRLDPLVFAVGGKEGADVERLAAAGRDRHGAVEDDVVADRSRGRSGAGRRRTSRAAPASPGCQPRRLPTRIAARTTKATPTRRYSGRISAVRPKRRPGRSQAPEPLLVARPRGTRGPRQAG